jgi:hypothetical protein
LNQSFVCYLFRNKPKKNRHARKIKNLSAGSGGRGLKICLEKVQNGTERLMIARAKPNKATNNLYMIIRRTALILEQIETFISNTFEHSETFFKNFLVI